MKDYEDEAFDELEKSLQRKVAHGVTDGSKVTIDRDKLEQMLESAYWAGFNESGEGYNAEYPFGDRNQNPIEDNVWKKYRDIYIKEALEDV